MGQLENGIFSCPDDTPVGTVVYESNSYAYVVKLSADGEKYLGTRPALFWRDGDCKAHAKYHCQICAKER
jgi:hypothetical protein